MQQALALGTQDARLFFHAGMIYRRLGQLQQARHYLARARAINPVFHVFHVEVADRVREELAATSGPTAVQGQAQ